MSEDIVLYSDGGGEKSSSAAGACIVEDVSSGERQKLLIFLGEGTNNEAEISGGLLGFAFIRGLIDSGEEIKSLRWVCDSEYVLKSATQYINAWQRNGWQTAAKKPVKNQGLWKTYLSLSRSIKVTAEHVRGHTGHPENEACDSAATWGRTFAEETLEDEGSGTIVSDGWQLIDGRDFLKTMRRDPEPDESSTLSLVQELHALGIDKFDSDSDSAPSEQIILRPVLSKLRSAHTQALSLKAKSENAPMLAQEILELIEKFEDL